MIVRKIGQRYIHRPDGVECILAQVAPNRVCLIQLTDGNRWLEPVIVGDVNNIHPLEWAQIRGVYKPRFGLVK